MEGKAVLQEWDCISAGDYARNWDIRFWLNQNRESIQGSEFYSGREKRMSLSVLKSEERESYRSVRFCQQNQWLILPGEATMAVTGRKEKIK